MSKASEFKKWKSERVGHPLGVCMGYDAVMELEGRIRDLEIAAGSLMKELSDHGYGDSENISNYIAISEHSTF